MKQRDIVMKLRCDECGDKYAIAEDELDDYNIYWMGDGRSMPCPKLLCPTCTTKWSKKVS